MIRLQRILAVLQKELMQLRRDRLTFGMIVMIPLIQLILFGYAINIDVRNIFVGVVDMSASAAGRIIVETVKATQVVKVKEFYETPEEGKRAIVRGEVRAVLVLPVNLSQRLVNNEIIGQWMVDGSDTMVSSALLQLQNMPLSQIVIDPMVNYSPAQQTFSAVLFFNPERRSAVNIVPGLSGVILTMTMILFTSAAIVRERERGNLELLITTPIKPVELMIGKILPYIAVGFIQLTIVLGLGHWVFGVPIVGSVVDIFVVTVSHGNDCAIIEIGSLRQ
jgi:ABC-2 type transport system permease protein